MSKRTCAAVALILGSILIHGTLPTAAPVPQAAPALARFTPGARLQSKFSGPVTITLQGDSRQAFQQLAALGGVQVIFKPQFAAAPIPQAVTLNAVDFAGALDRFARLAGAFWETYDGKTILVAPDDAAVRRQVEAQVFRSIALPPQTTAQRTTDIITAIRTRSEFKQLAINTTGNTLLVRDTAENVAFAEDFVAAAGGGTAAVGAAADASTILTDLAGNIFTPEGTALRKVPAPSHARLTAATSGPITFQVPGSSRDAFQALAERAGIQVLFHRQFQQAPIVGPLAFDGVDILTALDLLSFSTGNFWLALDERTIMVGTDNPTVRRELEPLTIKAFTLKNLSRQQEATELVTALRTLMSVNQIAMSTPQMALLLRDTAEKIALAERISAEFDRGLGSANARLAEIVRDPSFPSGVFGTPVDADERRAMLARLQPNPAGPFTVRMNQPPRQAFETIASMAGIQVVFHRQFPNTPAFPFVIQNTDLGTALDRLSMVTASFWTVVDPHTIAVASDNPTVRREMEQMVIKAMELRNLNRQQEVTEVVTALRTLLSFNQIAISTPRNTIVMRDSAHKIAMAEKIAAIFDRPRPGAAAGAPVGPAMGPSIPSGVFATPADEDAARAARKRLQVRAMPASISFSQPPRTAFETLAATAGIQVVFHRQFQSAGALAFACRDCDFFSAMDRLAFQTQNFWIVSDAHTVTVATDNPTVRREAEEMIVKTVYHQLRQQQATEMVTALRMLLSFNQVGMSTPANAIVLRDTAEKIGLAEKIVAIFDPQATSSVPISSGVFTYPMDAEARRTRLLAQLQLSSNGPFSASFNQSPRDAFEGVAGLAGIRVDFDPQIVGVGLLAFTDGGDWISVMDRLAFQTQTFWIPRDSKTILVAPDNPMTRRAAIPETTATIPLRNIGSAASVTEVIATLRSITSAKDVQAAGENAVIITDLPDVVALAERIVATIDVAGRPPVTTQPPATTLPRE